MSHGQRGPPAPGLCALEPTGPAGPYTCGAPTPLALGPQFPCAQRRGPARRRVSLQRAAGAEGRAAQAAILHHAQAGEAGDRVRFHAPLPGDRTAAGAGGAGEGDGETAQVRARGVASVGGTPVGRGGWGVDGLFLCGRGIFHGWNLGGVFRYGWGLREVGPS